MQTAPGTKPSLHEFVRSRWWLRYSAAIALAVVSILGRHALGLALPVEISPFLIGILGIVASAWLGGFLPGVVTLVVFTLLALQFNSVPRAGGWQNLDGGTAVTTIAYLAQSTLICFVIDLLVRSRQVIERHQRNEQLGSLLHRALASAAAPIDVCEAAAAALGAGCNAKRTLLWRRGGDGSTWSVCGAPPFEARLGAAMSARIGRVAELGTVAHDVVDDVPQTERCSLLLPITQIGAGSSGARPVEYVIELRGDEPFPADRATREFLASLCTDIAERLRRLTAESAVAELSGSLADRAGELHAVLDTAPIGLVVALNPACTEVLVNRAGIELLGLPPTPPGRDVLAIRSGAELPEGILSHMRSTAAGGPALGPVEATLVRRDGIGLDVFQSVSPLLDRHGQSRGAVSAIVDISQMRRAEREMREREQAFRRSFEHAGIGKAQIEPSSLRFSLVNRWLSDMLRHDVAALQTMRLSDVVEPADRGRIEDLVAGLLRGDAISSTTEIGMRDADGRLLHAAVSITAAQDDHGRTTHLISVIQDITARTQAEEELGRYRTRLEDLVAERTAALEQSNTQLRLSERMAALGTLCAGLGHDMGNLLLPVRLRLESMAMKGLPPSIADDVAAIGTCAEYLQRLANGLRLLSLDPDRSSVGETSDLTSWWPDVEAFFRNCLPRGVELQRSIAADLPAITVSKHRLTQAVFNLVQNAGDAVRDRPNGWVRVAARRSDDGSRVEIAVSDNGVGMDAATRSRCLEPFFTSKVRGISTGLGLSLVHGIVRQSGGGIEIESEPDHGTTFRLSFPIAQKPARSLEPKSTTPPVRAIVSLGDQRLRTYAAAVAASLGCEVEERPPDEVVVADATGGDGVSAPRGVAWVVESERLDGAKARAFLAQPGRRLVLFGHPPDGSLARESVHWREQLSPSVIRQAMREAVNGLADALDAEPEEATDASRLG